MKIIIDLPEARYKDIQRIAEVQLDRNHFQTAEQIIANGATLPKGHGRLIDADKCIRQAWSDFYKHEDEWEKKDPDYIGVKRLHDQNGFECCLKTICESPTIIEADKAESEEV